jgi:hypothetical protein
MKMKMTWLAALALLSGPVSCTRLSSPPSSAPAEAARSQSEAPWKRGKPKAPVSIDSEFHGQLEPGVEVPLRLRVTPHQPCTSLRIEARGLEGATVSGGEAREHGACVVDQEVMREVTVRLTPGASGLTAVTASLEMEGRLQSSTVAIPLEVRGGVLPGAEKRTSPLGQVDLDAEGHPIILMENHPL